MVTSTTKYLPEMKMLPMPRNMEILPVEFDIQAGPQSWVCGIDSDGHEFDVLCETACLVAAKRAVNSGIKVLLTCEPWQFQRAA